MRGKLCACAIAVLLGGHAMAADVTYTYDALGRLIHTEYGSTSVVYSYDSTGNRIALSTAANAGPTANPDSAATSSGVVTFDPRSNDTDPDKDALTITAPGATPLATAHGSVVGTSSSVTYTATAGYHGTDTYSYTISDGNGHAASATDTITVP